MPATTPTLSDGHLWLHFTAAEAWLGDDPRVRVLDRGAGCYLWDMDGRRYLDGLSALFCVQVGYGRTEITRAAAAQMDRLSFATNWGVAHQPAIDLAAALSERFPGELTHTFFVNSGSEAVEAALKLARQYHQARGEPERSKVISRRFAYHGTTLGALGVTGLTSVSEMFQPLLAGHRYAPTTNAYRPQSEDPAGAIEDLILQEGPETVSAVFLEPVQNAGGCLTPPEGYFKRVRDICDRYGALLVSDEVICGFGRLGTWTGAERYGFQPDIITFAKGVTSGYAPMGGITFDRAVGDALRGAPGGMYVHGSTWGGHPVACAAALANLAVFAADDVLGNVQRNEGWLRDQLDELAARHPLVGDVRGTGYFYALELVADRDDRTPLSAEAAAALVDGFLVGRLPELGLLCRVDQRDAPVIQLAPPLVADRAVLGEMVEILDRALTEARTHLHTTAATRT